MTEIVTATGIMSGSSLDGTDLACCEFTFKEGIWSYRILAAETVPYPAGLRTDLEEAFRWDSSRIRELDLKLGRFFGEQAYQFHRRHRLHPDLIASHGHTLFHDPDRGITLQLGDGAILAREAGITVVNDFRSEDVSKGGQGAPLVPAGDRILFGNYEACLNLGGFANISYCDDRGTLIAFDIGPANLALDRIARMAGKEYDQNGELAAGGNADPSLLREMNSLEYYRKPPPKSLGKEWFSNYFEPLLDRRGAGIKDLMATACEHIAYQTGQAIRGSGADTLLATGGGAMNRTLMDRIRYYSTARIHVPGEELVRFKEAIVFALLGILRLRGEVNCLASVTGGPEDLSAGKIHRT